MPIDIIQATKYLVSLGDSWSGDKAGRLFSDTKIGPKKPIVKPMANKYEFKPSGTARLRPCAVTSTNKNNKIPIEKLMSRCLREVDILRKNQRGASPKYTGIRPAIVPRKTAYRMSTMR
jgi:hypothetical protein